MDSEAIVLIIPIMALAIPFYAMWIRHKREERQMQVHLTGERSGQDANRIAELEDRVRVLERIVTDGSYDVATQIEALRDQRRVDELIEDKARP
jgi:hypothetical protein